MPRERPDPETARKELKKEYDYMHFRHLRHDRHRIEEMAEEELILLRKQCFLERLTG